MKLILMTLLANFGIKKKKVETVERFPGEALLPSSDCAFAMYTTLLLLWYNTIYLLHKYILFYTIILFQN